MIWSVRGAMCGCNMPGDQIGRIWLWDPQSLKLQWFKVAHPTTDLHSGSNPPKLAVCHSASALATPQIKAIGVLVSAARGSALGLG